jgi:hypothetical protein
MTRIKLSNGTTYIDHKKAVHGPGSLVELKDDAEAKRLVDTGSASLVADASVRAAHEVGG